MPGATKPHFNKKSFRLLQRQQEFLEGEVSAEENKHAYAKRNEPISTPADLQKVAAHMSRLDECFSGLVDVTDSYAPRVGAMLRTVWARQTAFVSRLKHAVRHHMEAARSLQENQDALDERNEKLTIQTKRSLGMMNSDVQQLETELIQAESKLSVATKLNESLQAELGRLREQVHGNNDDNSGTSFYELNQEFEKGLNMTEESMARNEANLNHLNDVFKHFEIKCLEAVLMQEQVVKVTRSTQTERQEHRMLLSDALDGELAPIPVVEPEPGQHIPIALRRMMATHPKSKRIMSQQALDKLILRMFVQKIGDNAAQVRKSQPLHGMAAFVYGFMSDKYGLQSLTDPHIVEFVGSIRNYKEKSFFALCMGKFLGCFGEPDAKPPYDVRLDCFFISVLEELLEQHEKHGQDSATAVEASGQIVMDVGHRVADKMFNGAAPEMLHEMFGSLNALDIVSDPASKEDKVRLDHYLKILVDTWVRLDTTWKFQLQRVYNDYAKFFYEVNGFMIETTDSTHTRDGAKFYALCSFPGFADILAETDPSVLEPVAKAYFEEALEHLSQLKAEEHERLWQEYEDPVTGKSFFYNAATNESYWSRPKLESFEVGEITLPAFIYVAEKHRIGSPPHAWNMVY